MKQVLLIFDEPDLRDLVKFTLLFALKDTIEIQLAEPNDVVDTISENQLDLIVINIKGIVKHLQAIQQLPVSETIPILVMEYHPVDHEKLKQLGTNIVFQRPYIFDDITKATKELLNLP